MKVKVYQLRLNVSYNDVFKKNFTADNRAECQVQWSEFKRFAESHKLAVNDYPAVEDYSAWSPVFASYDTFKGAAAALEIMSRFPRETYIEQVIEVEA